MVGAGGTRLAVSRPHVAQGSAETIAVPRFEVDPAWPPKLPNDWVMGEVTWVTVDRRDHVWILQRPRTVAADRADRAAPPVLEFDAAGKFVQAWGGPAAAYEWPDMEHGITVDYKDHVWIGGISPDGAVRVSDRSDDMLLKFTTGGEFIKQFGRRNASEGNNDTKNLMGPADVFVHPKTNEAFIADGYGNRRVIVLDADTGAFKRMWGAFGNVPVDVPRITGAGKPTAPLNEEGPGSPQFLSVHGLGVSNDGLVYVADRSNRRIQVFTLGGKFVTQTFIHRRGPSDRSAGAVAFSPDPSQQFVYLADYGNSRIVIANRMTLDIVDSFGSRSSHAGDFQGLHNVAADSKGNLYTAEVNPGRRAQKFVFKGMSPAAGK
jgi:DNA-binding beta-propeller fold protein YncE